MTQRGRLDLYLNSQFLENIHSFEYEIGRLGEKLDDTASAVLARLIFSLGRPGERPLLGFCPAFEDKFRSVTEEGWLTLQERPATRNQAPWVIGRAESMNAFRRVYQLAWNSADNEPVVVVFARDGDPGDAFAEVEKVEGLFPGHEEPLLRAYPTIASRYYDGLWLRVLARKLTPADVAECLDTATRETDT